MDTKANVLDLLASRGQGKAPADALSHVAGARFTEFLQRSWCVRRSVNPGVLVVSMLPDEVRRRLLVAWLNAGAAASSFFVAEADALLDFIAGQLPDDSPELAVCRLEQLMLRANDDAGAFRPPAPGLFDPRRIVCRATRAGLVFFDGKSEPVLSALLPSSAPYSPLPRWATALLVAPGSKPLCRIASPLECALWTGLGGPSAAATLVQDGIPREVIESMLHIGALEYA